MKENSKISGRFFIVGCSRSGTTLLQNLLASHPAIQSFPESHFFAMIISRGWRRKAGIADKRGVQRLGEFVSECRLTKLENLIPNNGFLVKAYVKAFVSILDEATLAGRKTCWIEKTPRHLHYIADIEKFIPEAKFIHLLRKGEDVVASLFEVSEKYPDKWGGPKSIDQCIERWKGDLDITLKYQSRRNHFVVKYEEMVTETELVLKKIFSFLGFSNNMNMEEFHNASHSGNTVLSWEEWKQGASQPVNSDLPVKFEKIFSETQKEYIRNQLEKIR